MIMPQIKNQLSASPYDKYCITFLTPAASEAEFKKILANQTAELSKPLLLSYPSNEFPKIYKEIFNALLKVGKQKNSSKKIHELLNVITDYLHTIYQKEKASKNMAGAPYLPKGCKESAYTSMKDEMYVQLVKQISQNSISKSLMGYLQAFEIMTRYYYPSCDLIYPLYNQIDVFLALFTNGSDEQKPHILKQLTRIQENLMLFMTAIEGENGASNSDVDFGPQESTNYLLPRETALHPKETEETGQCYQMVFRLMNNEGVCFPVRNESVGLMKKRVLKEFFLERKFANFGLYFLEGKQSYKFIPDDTKLIDLAYLTVAEASENPLYLRIKHYFPFVLKQGNITRLTYMNLVTDELNFPWDPKNYEVIVAQSMIFDDFEEARIANYLHITNQASAKTPNTKAVEAKYAEISGEAAKKCCEFEYMKFMKSIGFLTIKCYRQKDDPAFTVGVKPLEIVVFVNNVEFASIGMERVKKISMVGPNIVIELMFKPVGSKEPERMRTLTLPLMEKQEELYEDLAFYFNSRA